MSHLWEYVLFTSAAGAIHDGIGHFDTLRLRKLMMTYAGQLERAGIQPQEPVIVAVANRAPDVAAILAVMRAGGVAVPVHRRTHADTAAAVLATTGSRLLLNACPEGSTSLVCEGLLSVLRDSPPPGRPLLDKAAIITFTSGSTGQPKGVVLSGERTARKLAAISERLSFPAGAASLVPLQLTFSFGQWVTFLTLLRGGTVHLHDKLDLATVAERIEDAQIDYFAAVPTMLRTLLTGSAGQQPVQTHILTGGEAVSAELRHRIKTAWPASRISSIYGLTETGTCDFFHCDWEPGGDDDTLGKVAPGIDYRLDPASGELMIRTPFGMLGYLDQPEATAAALPDSWLRTGDIAKEAGEGRVALIGRLKELINRGGNKVSPLEIERLFSGHPDIAATLATGVSDPRLGEVIHLLAVPQPGKQLSAASLRAWADGRMERYKLPDRIHIVQELPLGRTGKADRALLRRMIEAGKF